MKKLPLQFLILGCFLFMTGCWDSKDAEETNFVTSTGIDYLQKEKAYSIYTQMLNFKFLSKTEGQSVSGQKSAYVGHSSSPSLELAFTNLYRTSQWRTSWAHTSSIILSDNAIKEQGGLFFWDLFTRHPEFRLTLYIFGTKEPIDQLMLLEPLFGGSPRHTLLQQTDNVYQKQSLIKPLIMFEYGKQITEPAQTVLLPSLGIDKNTWQDSESRSPKPFINGAYLFYKQSFKGWLSLIDLKGDRWMQKKTERTSLVLTRSDTSSNAAIIIKNQGVRISSLLNEDFPKYDIEVKLTGNLVELHNNLTVSEIEELAAKQVEQEIRETFRRAIAIDADVFNLEHAFYKQHTKQWIETPDDSRKVREDSLRQVRVTVKIQSSGMDK